MRACPRTVRFRGRWHGAQWHPGRPPDGCRTPHSPDPGRARRFRLAAPAGFIAQPWGLLNHPSVILTHANPPRPRSGATNDQIKRPNKHTISSIDEKICMFAIKLARPRTAVNPDKTDERPGDTDFQTLLLPLPPSRREPRDRYVLEKNAVWCPDLIQVPALPTCCQMCCGALQRTSQNMLCSLKRCCWGQIRDSDK